MSFNHKYGPWALVAGASEGIGAAMSRALAARGISLVLVARRRGPLQALADELSRTVEVRIVCQDLGAPDAGVQLDQATADLDIGLVIYNACYSVIGKYLDLSVQDKLTTVDVNCRGPVLVTSAFAPRLVARGRGGLLLMSSMSGFQGSAMVGTYAATKAFDTVLGECLWEELGPLGVDVLVCVAGATRTPGFDNNTPEAKRASVFPMQPEDVAREALARLGRGGPTMIAGRTNRLVAFVLNRLLPRAGAVRFISRNTRRVYDQD